VWEGGGGGTFNPGSCEDLLGAQLLVDVGHGDALQLCHLLLEDDGVLGFPAVVQLVEEAASPLVNDPSPLGLVLQEWWTLRCVRFVMLKD